MDIKYSGMATFSHSSSGQFSMQSPQEGFTLFQPSVPPQVFPGNVKVDVFGSGGNSTAIVTYSSGATITFSQSTDPRIFTPNMRVDMRVQMPDGRTSTSSTMMYEGPNGETRMRVSGTRLDGTPFPPGDQEVEIRVPENEDFRNHKIPTEVNSDFSRAQNWTPPRDPLVLDLDGDGIEAIGISPTSPILFDHDADAVKTATGWIKADDGIVVRDLNGNGMIDSGRELFGDNTILTSGPRAGDTASNGFTALADLDTNADGKIDSSDAVFGDLRIWQDVNQDGISQGNELKTLTQLGISGIGVVGTASSVNLGDGNTQPWTATFTRNDGSSGTSAVAELSGSLLLASNGFFREFTDDPTLTSNSIALPQISGSGWVRDLREAMSLGTAKADALEDRVEEFASATTRDAQIALIDELLADWGRTSGKMLESRFIYHLVPQAGRIVTSDEPIGDYESVVLLLHTQGLEVSVYDEFSHRYKSVPTAEGMEVLRRLNVLEAFNGSKFLQFPTPSSPENFPGLDLTSVSSGGGGGGGGGGGEVGNRPSEAHATLWASQIELLNHSYDALRESVYGALVVQTRLKPYLDEIQLVVDEEGVRVDLTALDAALEARRGVDERNAVLDLIDLNRYAKYSFNSIEFAGMSKLRTWIEALPQSSSIRAELTGLNMYVGGALSGSVTADLFLGDADDNVFSSGVGADVLDGGLGNDTLYGGDDNDILYGGAGNDWLYGENGNDILEGGAGNDTLFNSWGNKVFVFGRGDGQDRIMSTFDATVGKRNILQLQFGVAPSDVVLKQATGGSLGGRSALEVSIAGTADKVLIDGFFAQSSPYTGYNTVHEIHFADGTVWDIPEILNRLFSGTPNDDIINGTILGDAISGREGSDVLYGGDGDDTLSGGEGNDTLYGENGNDTLDGGAGNDTLYNSWGNKTYLFGRGDGQDVIGHAFDDTPGKLNTLQLKEGVAPSDVVLKQVAGTELGGASALEVSISGTSDRITFNGFFYQANPRGGYSTVHQIRFADGTTWDIDALVSKALTGTSAADVFHGTIAADVIHGNEGADTLYGEAGNDVLHGDEGNDTLYGGNDGDVLHGGAGDDFLYGENGNDTLDGGAGNDTLHNSWGNKTFMFGKGDGQDVVKSVFDGTTGKLNTLQLKEGVLQSELVFRRVTTNELGAESALEVTIAGTNDKITFNGFFYQGNPASGYSTIHQVRFADGTILDASAIIAQVNGGGSSGGLGTTLVGSGSLQGTAYNDFLTANAAQTVLTGGAGDDMLSAMPVEAVWDLTFEGGLGNDIIVGSYARDHFKFNRGDGNDVITDDVRTYPGPTAPNYYAADPTRSDYQDDLQFGTGISQSDVTASRIGQDLVLTVNNDGGSVTIKNWFESIYTRVERISFSDGSFWNISQVNAMISNGVELSGGGILQGTANNDTITATAANATLIGGAGNDVLVGSTGASVWDLTLEGGTGNDTISGSYARDLFKFNRGDGHDIISDDVRSYPGSTAPTYYAADPQRSDYQDVLQFGTGVSASDVTLTRSGLDLVFALNNSGGSVTIKNWFESIFTRIEKVSFADGSAWNVGGINAAMINGGTVSGSTIAPSGVNLTGSGTLQGSAFSDTLRANAFGVTLLGGAGDDDLGLVFSGSNYGHTYEGGLGNDTIGGSYAGDTFRFDRGDGNDTITDDVRDYPGSAATDAYTANPDNPSYQDVLQLGAGIVAADITLTKTGQDLVLTVNNNGGSVTVKNWFESAFTRIEKFTFADGSFWSVGMIQSAMANGGSVSGSVLATYGVTLVGGGTLQGTANADFLTANAGNTYLLGGAGDDTLSTIFGPAIFDLTFEGGTGNDSIKGSFARDYYKFGRGDGSDTISDNVADYGPDAVTHFRNYPGDVTYHDKITFGTNITADQLWLRQLGDDLEISVIGTQDKITVKDWYLDDLHRIEILALSNGQKLLDSQVQNLVQAMAAFSPPAAGQTTLPTNYASTLNPTLAANWQ